MSNIKESATQDPFANSTEAIALDLRLNRLGALIAKLQGEIAELELLICNLALTDRDTAGLQDDLHRRLDDLAEAIEQRIRLLTDGQRD